MITRYDALLKSLNRVERDSRVIVDRKSDKVQEVSLKRFELFSNIVEAATHQIKSRIQSNPSIEGEKKLAQLRKFNAIFSAWESALRKSSPRSVEELKSEQAKIHEVIDKVSKFKDSIGGDSIELKSLYSEVTEVDKKNFQALNKALKNLKAEQSRLDKLLESKVSEMDAKADHVWFKWVSDYKSPPNASEFKKAFIEIYGVDPNPSVFEDLIKYNNTVRKPEIAENVWIYLSSKNERPPTWNEFKSLFKESLGVDPEKNLYSNIAERS